MDRRYSNLQIFVHWIVVLLIVVQYVTSGAITRLHQLRLIGQKPNPTDALLFTIHGRIGLAILALMVGRLVIRLARGKGPGRHADIVGMVGQLVHWSFYGVVIAETVSGAVANYFWWPASAVHVMLFRVLLVLLVFHVSATGWRQFVLRDGTLREMLPHPKT